MDPELTNLINDFQRAVEEYGEARYNSGKDDGYEAGRSDYEDSGWDSGYESGHADGFAEGNALVEPS
jgi:hypothetical protein